MNTEITVKGRRYRRIDSRSCNHLGSQFWGKHVFLLRDVETGEHFEAYGKVVAHNSTLRPAIAGRWAQLTTTV